MRLPLMRVVGVGWLYLLAFSACGGTDPNPLSKKDTAPDKKTEQTTGKDLGPATYKDFDRTRFDRPTEIDNEWFPLKPGTQFVYEGSVSDDGRRIPHRVVLPSRISRR